MALTYSPNPTTAPDERPVSCALEVVRHVGQPAHCAQEPLRHPLGACATRGGMGV